MQAFYRILFGIVVVLSLAAVAHAAPKVNVLNDFEQDSDVRQWSFSQKSQSISDQHVTSGKHSLKIAGNEGFSIDKKQDWSGFDSLDMDIFVEGDGPMVCDMFIGDEAWQAKSTYWNRHNGNFNLKPGANTISIPVGGLYRGEAGSRNNDIKTNIDPSKIVRCVFTFKAEGQTALYLDNLRLVKEDRPEGILAFDFGPDSQVVALGFTPIGPGTVYGKSGNKAGLRAAAGSGRARDDTFPTRLYQDFIDMNGDQFIADVPNGKIHVWVMFDDPGYWGGEQAHFQKHTIKAQGKVVDTEDRDPADYLFRFEKIEPKPGDNIWDLYMKNLFKARQFEATVTEGKLVLEFNSDVWFSTKVAGIIIYPDAIKAEAAKWVAEVEKRNQQEFDSRAVFLGPNPQGLDAPPAAAQQGIWIGYPSLEDAVTMMHSPGPDGKLARSAARGQRVSYTFAVRPLKDFGAVKLTATDLKGSAGTIPAARLDLRYVHQAIQRGGFGAINYRIGPERLRKIDGSGLSLAKNMTRQFWITLDVPADAKAGTYTGSVTLAAGGQNIDVPLTVEVLGITLDEPDYIMTFYGAHVPAELAKQKPSAEMWRDLFTTLRQNGMNTLSGGPNIGFNGFDAAGKPILDFAAVDEYMKVARECGFTKEISGYGGPGYVSGLHDGAEIGETGHAWEKKTGKSFEEILKIVWGAVKEHGDQQNWLPIAYGFIDEPRVIETAQEQLKLLQAYRNAVPFVKIGGSYSVRWDDTPLEKSIQDIFKTLEWSALGGWSQTDIDKAKEFNKRLFIYNQGTSRYSFGAYQWSAMQRGIKGRVQWHLLALHGYQFFDLDGREPDFAMINWGTSGIIPTIHLAWCREGADDFRFAVTLWNLAEKNKDKPEAKAAQAWLTDMAAKIGCRQNNRPAGFPDDEGFRNTCIEHIRKLQQ